MADEVLNAAAPVAATTQAASPVPAPAHTVVDAASPIPAAPALDAAPSAPAVDAAPVVEAPKTVLGAEPPKAVEPVKSPDAPVEIKKEEVAQSVEPAPLPTYEAFKLPEGFTFADDKLSEFTKELGEFQNLTKADQAEMQKFGQKLLDRHISGVQETVTRLNEQYANAWEKQKVDWKEAFQKDPEIGGNRQETTVQAALQFIRTHGGTEAQQQEFRQLMESSGLGNHPAMIRMLAKASMNMSEGKPLPATKPEPQATSKVAKRYGGTT